MAVSNILVEIDEVKFNASANTNCARNNEYMHALQQQYGAYSVKLWRQTMQSAKKLDCIKAPLSSTRNGNGESATLSSERQLSGGKLGRGGAASIIGIVNRRCKALVHIYLQVYIYI